MTFIPPTILAPPPVQDTSAGGLFQQLATLGQAGSFLGAGGLGSVPNGSQLGFGGFTLSAPPSQFGGQQQSQSPFGSFLSDVSGFGQGAFSFLQQQEAIDEARRSDRLFAQRSFELEQRRIDNTNRPPPPVISPRSPVSAPSVGGDVKGAAISTPLVLGIAGAVVALVLVVVTLKR